MQLSKDKHLKQGDVENVETKINIPDGDHPMPRRANWQLLLEAYRQSLRRSAKIIRFI